MSLRTIAEPQKCLLNIYRGRLYKDEKADLDFTESYTI